MSVDFAVRFKGSGSEVVSPWRGVGTNLRDSIRRAAMMMMVISGKLEKEDDITEIKIEFGPPR